MKMKRRKVVTTEAGRTSRIKPHGLNLPVRLGISWRWNESDVGNNGVSDIFCYYEKDKVMGRE